MRSIMHGNKKTWVAPRLRRLEPTPELQKLFEEELERRERPPDKRAKRFG